jgi:hypothetical protein
LCCISIKAIFIYHNHDRQSYAVHNRLNIQNKSGITSGFIISAKRKRQLHSDTKLGKVLNLLSMSKDINMFLNRLLRLQKNWPIAIVQQSENKSKATWTIVKDQLGI